MTSEIKTQMRQEGHLTTLTFGSLYAASIRGKSLVSLSQLRTLDYDGDFLQGLPFVKGGKEQSPLFTFEPPVDLLVTREYMESDRTRSTPLIVDAPKGKEGRERATRITVLSLNRAAADDLLARVQETIGFTAMPEDPLFQTDFRNQSAHAIEQYNSIRADCLDDGTDDEGFVSVMWGAARYRDLLMDHFGKTSEEAGLEARRKFLGF